jgi:predicted transcriptional regulator
MSIPRPQRENSRKREKPHESNIEQEMNNYILLEKLPGGSARRDILQLLKKPKNCNELARKLGVNWTTVAFHLKKLVEASLVKEIRYGKHIYYQIQSKEVKQ